MNTKNVLISGIVGGIAYFFLGWLIYGILLMDYMTSISPVIAGLNRTEEEFVWWAMIASNILSGIFMAYIFDLAKVSGWMNGAKIGGLIGLLISASVNLSLYSMTNMIGKKGILLDAAAGAVMTALGGIIIISVMGMLNKKS
jgi:hypothetical protein